MRDFLDAFVDTQADKKLRWWTWPLWAAHKCRFKEGVPLRRKVRLTYKVFVGAWKIYRKGG